MCDKWYTFEVCSLSVMAWLLSSHFLVLFPWWIFLAMNTALALIIFFMVYWNRTFDHNMITAIAMAAYTFTTFTVAIINLIKYRKYNSPILFASKTISMAAACVSMLTLESTMLTTFNDGSMSLASRRIMLGTTGTAVSYRARR